MDGQDDAWARWKEQVFGNGYMIWHDGLDVGAVTGLTGAAREEALQMLRLGVSLGDDHAAEALAAMGEVDDAPAMREQLAGASGSQRVRIALALHAVAPEPGLAAHLVDVLRGRPSWSERIDAAIGLRHFAGPDDEAALLATVAGDPEYLVRYHASESLLQRWGVRPASVADHDEIFERIRRPHEGAPTDADFARYAEASALLQALAPRDRA